jgi:hypothetical protein
VLVTADPREAAAGRRRAVHRRLGLDGPVRRRAAAARPRGVLPRRRRGRRRRRARSSCTACPPTAARRSPRPSSTGRCRRCGTRPRTACTPRRRC